MRQPSKLASRQNDKIKHLKKLQELRKVRDMHGCFVMEHPKHIADYIRVFPNALRQLFCVDGLVPDFPISDAAEFYAVGEDILSYVSRLKSPSGMVAVFDKSDVDFEALDWSHMRRIVVLDQIADPGNLGSILRSCRAFAVDAVALTEGSCDPYHPDVIGSGAGVGAMMPIFELTDVRWGSLLEQGFSPLLLDPHASQDIASASAIERPVFVFGSEGRGLVSSYISASERESYHIPMQAGVESINVAVCAGIVLSSTYPRV